jgi:ABC-2 type transport system permease protein
VRSIFKMTWVAIKLSFRTKIAVFFMVIMPVGFFFIYCGLFAHGQPAAVAETMEPLVTLLVITNGLYGVGFTLVAMRERDILRCYHLAPLRPIQIMISNILAVYMTLLPTIVMLFALAKMVYHMPMPHSLLGMSVVFSLGFLALAGIGMVVAGASNTAQEAQVINQVLLLALLFLSGATVPLSHLSQSIQRIALFLPTTLMILAGQGVMLSGHGLKQHLPELVGLAVTSVASLGLAVAVFRWDKEVKPSPKQRLGALLALIPMLIFGIWLNTSPNVLHVNLHLLRPETLHLDPNAPQREPCVPSASTSETSAK